MGDDTGGNPLQMAGVTNHRPKVLGRIGALELGKTRARDRNQGFAGRVRYQMDVEGLHRGLHTRPRMGMSRRVSVSDRRIAGKSRSLSTGPAAIVNNPQALTATHSSRTRLVRRDESRGWMDGATVFHKAVERIGVDGSGLRRLHPHKSRPVCFDPGSFEQLQGQFPLDRNHRDSRPQSSTPIS